MKQGQRVLKPYQPYPKMIYNGNQATVVENAEQHRTLTGWTESRDLPGFQKGDIAPPLQVLQFRQARAVVPPKPSKAKSEAEAPARFTETL